MNDTIRFVLMLFLIFYILTADTDYSDPYENNIDRDYILDQYKKEMNVSRSELGDLDYYHGYGNITGFRLSYEDSIDGKNESLWEPVAHFEEDQRYSILPDEISRLAGNIWNFEEKTVELGDAVGEKVNEGDYPININGTVSGDYQLDADIKFHRLHLPVPSYLTSLDKYRREKRLNSGKNNDDSDDDHIDENKFEMNSKRDPDSDSDSDSNLPVLPRPGNITDFKGIVSLSMENFPEQYSNDTHLVQCRISINNIEENNENKLILTGVYHQDTGNLVLTSSSSKFQAIYALPHLNLGYNDYFNRTIATLFGPMNKSSVDDFTFSSIENAVDSNDQCEYIGYFHYESTNLSKSQLREIEKEYTNPIGRPSAKIPQLKISKGLLYSPDCGILINLNEPLLGNRIDVFKDQLKYFILSAIVVMFLQLLLVIREMSIMSNPSALSKLSFFTIMIMNSIDSAISIVSLVMSIVYTDLYIQFAMLAFLSFTCSAMYEIRFGVKIYCLQINERPLDWRTMLRGTPIDERRDREAENGNGNANEEGVPQQQAPTPATIPVVPIDTSEQAVSAELYSRNFFFFIICLIIFFNLSGLPRSTRRVAESIAYFLLNSLWVFQIYRNTLRGSSESFTWEFIVFESILRLLPFEYILLFPNIFDHHQDTTVGTILIVWVLIQLIVLYLQKVYGARFFLSEKYLPKAYDYHPVIHKQDLLNFHVDPESLEDDQEEWVTDCAICMQKVEIPIEKDNELTPLEEGQIDSFENANDLEAGLLNQQHNQQHSNGGPPIRKAYMITPCFHVFHTDCLENWMMYKLQCPNCRSSIPPF